MEKKRRIIPIRLLYIGVFAMLLFIGCKPDEPQMSERVVLVYLIGDNNLDSHLRNNLSDMEKGMKGVNGKMIVYHDGLNETPKLYLIDSEGKRKFLQELPEATNSCSPERLKEILDYLFRDFPARSYGMILSSHGYGWIPYQTTQGRSGSQKRSTLVQPLREERTNPLTRHFGDDGNPKPQQKFEIATLAACFPQDRRFDFLFFDACFMASVESLYEMRNCSRYTLASQAEVLAHGAPFEKICHYLFADNNQLPALCNEYMNFYLTDQSIYISGKPSAGITLIDNTRLEALAQSAKELLNGVTASEIAAIGSQVQVCERELVTIFNDLGHFYSLLRPEKYPQFRSALSQTVIFEKHTETIYSDLGNRGTFSATHFTGLNCFVPLRNRNTVYNPFFYQTKWAQAVEMPEL